MRYTIRGREPLATFLDVGVRAFIALRRAGGVVGEREDVRKQNAIDEPPVEKVACCEDIFSKRGMEPAVGSEEEGEQGGVTVRVARVWT